MEEDKLMEVWRTHYDKISNEEFTWDRIGFDRCKSCLGLVKVSIGSVVEANGKMKQGKSAGLRELQQRCSRLL